MSGFLEMVDTCRRDRMKSIEVLIVRPEIIAQPMSTTLEPCFVRRDEKIGGRMAPARLTAPKLSGIILASVLC